jgi:hypothetical protein
MNGEMVDMMVDNEEWDATSQPGHSRSTLFGVQFFPSAVRRDPTYTA